jgi:hypothetical protein
MIGKYGIHVPGDPIFTEECATVLHLVHIGELMHVVKVLSDVLRVKRDARTGQK